MLGGGQVVGRFDKANNGPEPPPLEKRCVAALTDA